MPNPKAPRRSRTASETQDEQSAFVERLRRLGATDDELALVVEHWDDFDDDWTIEKRRETLRLSDDELLNGLLSARDEYAQHTLTEEEQADVERAQRWEALLIDARGIIGLSVARVVEWVDGDSVRAQAVLAVENEAQQPRRTLIDALAPLTTGGDGSVS